jgi:hypothetical protein
VPAGLDPRNATTKVAELVKFAIKHGLSPNFLAHLIPEQTTPKADLRTPSIDRTTSNARAHRPTRERAQRAIEAVYGSNIPDQTSEPNAILCRKIGDWLKANKLPEVSDDTILRAAGRRK